MPNAHILIVDDEPQVAESIQQLLIFEGYTADVATNLAETEALLLKRIYDAAIVDLRMADVSGIDILATCRMSDPAMALLMLTAFGTVEAATKAFKLGVKDFLTKPVSRENLCGALERALDVSRLQREVRNLRQQTQTTASFSALVGESSKLKVALDLAARAAASDIPVLICGETGTGKELIAASIHNSSSRRTGLMVTAVLVGAQDLLESELFGHTKGAFTGAVTSRRGYFQEADKGTLFLDELTEVSQHTQVALLRALDQKRIRAVGSDRENTVDVRIICATNRKIEEEIVAGRFRADLYYRIAGIRIELPSLRERREDIPLLAAHFVSKAVGEVGSIPEIEPEALTVLQEYHWPGNVRELRNVMNRAVLLSGGETLGAMHWRHALQSDLGFIRKSIGGE
jgi:DNA-binding NtrC family response regulator